MSAPGQNARASGRARGGTGMPAASAASAEAARSWHGLRGSRLLAATIRARASVRSGAAATEWMVKAAESDFASARPIAAIRLWNGDHVEKDRGKAEAFWTKAKNDPECAAYLAALAFVRSGVAGGGIGPAAWELAQRYAAGTGVERDVDKVWKYLPIAAEGDVADAQYFLAKAYDDGDGPYERNESKRDDWLRRARKLGHEKATEWIDAIEKARSDAAMEAVGNLVKKELKSHWDAGVKGGAGRGGVRHF